MTNWRTTLNFFATVVLGLLFFALTSWSQAVGPNPAPRNALGNPAGPPIPGGGGDSPQNTANQDATTPNANAAGNGFGYGLFSGFGLPDPFKRRLVSQFSVGESRDQGILNGAFSTLGGPAALDSEVSGSFTYDLPRSRSDYIFQYATTGRYYNQYKSLDSIAQDAGFNQTVLLGPNTRWNLGYRFDMSPDLAGSLMAETLSQELSFLDPLPVIGISGLPTPSLPISLIDPLPAGAILPTPLLHPLFSPADGLVTLRSMHISNTGDANFTHQFTPSTGISFRADFSRVAYQDQNLYDTNQYLFSGGINHVLNSRMMIGFYVRGAIIDLSNVFDRTSYQSGGITLTRQVGQSGSVTFELGPSLIHTEGQQSIALPTLLANLLGRSSLNRSSSQSILYNDWLGSVNYTYNLRKLKTVIRPSFSRGITDTGGLAGAAMTQTAAVAVQRGIGGVTSVTVTFSYIKSQVIGLNNSNSLQLDQEGLSASITRRLSQSLDFVAYVNYAKVLGGQQGPTLLNYNQAGVRFVYHFPRITPQ